MIRAAIFACCMMLAALDRRACAERSADSSNVMQSLWPEAQALGISRKTFDDATRGLKPNLSLPDLIIPGKPKDSPRGQAEFERTPARISVGDRSLRG